MLTGRKAFEGSTRLSTMSAILKEEPKPVEHIPAELDRILRRCLRKDRDKRFQHMDDVKIALEEVREESESGKFGAMAAKPAAAASRRWPWLAGGLVALGLLAGSVLWFVRNRPAAEARPASLVLNRVTADPGLNTTPAISLDGKLLAYASDRATNGDHLDIWVRHMGGGDPVRLTNNDGDETEPAFSADGSRVAYSSSRGGIFVVPALGGESRQLVARGSRPRFSPDGKWLAYHVAAAGAASGTVNREVWVMPAIGGAPRRLAPQFLDASHPAWARDSSRILFHARKERSQQSVDWWVTTPDGAEPAGVGVRPLLREARLNSFVTFPEVWTGDWVVFSGAVRDNIHLWKLRIGANGRPLGKVEQITSGTGREQHPVSRCGWNAGRGQHAVRIRRLDVAG